MYLEELIKLIEGELICGRITSEAIINKACASDLMSDVLTLRTDSMLLITGLVNMQTIRTAEMADIQNILFVRNKKPSPEMINLAKQEGINIILSNKSMFATCGILANAGIKAVY
jgi:predicted transcriptional regulator